MKRNGTKEPKEAEPMSDSPTLISQRQLAMLLGITPQTLSVWISAGRCIPPLVREGKYVRWDLDEVNAWIRAGKPLAEDWAARKRQQPVPQR